MKISAVVVRGSVHALPDGDDGLDDNPTLRGRTTSWARFRMYRLGEIVSLDPSDFRHLEHLGLVKAAV